MQAPWRCGMGRPQPHVSVYTYMSIYKFVHVYIDWCCVYYSIRNNLVALAKCRVRVGQLCLQDCAHPMITFKMYFHTSIFISPGDGHGIWVLTLTLKLTLKFLNSKKIVLKDEEFKFVSKNWPKIMMTFWGKNRGAAPRNIALRGCASHTHPRFVLNVWPQWCWPILTLHYALSWKLYFKLLKSL